MSYTAPDGTRIEGAAQIDHGVWPVYWREGSANLPAVPVAEYEYEDDWPDAEWASVYYAGCAVLIDANGEEWLSHHLIPKGSEALSDLAVGAARAETAARKRVWLFEQVCGTCEKDTTTWRMADSHAAGERLAAHVHRETFDREKSNA